LGLDGRRSALATGKGLMPLIEGTRDPQLAADRAALKTLTIQYNQVKSGIATVNADMDSILAGPASPTAAQTGKALKLIAQDMQTTMTGLGMILDALKVIIQRQQQNG
jgi:hypothetical protein